MHDSAHARLNPGHAPALRAGKPPPVALLRANTADAIDTRRSTSTAAGVRTALPRLSCAVPCRNEAPNLERLLPQLRRTLNRCARESEVVLVDDGSTEGSARRAWAKTRATLWVIDPAALGAASALACARMPNGG